ncbi:MAG: MFS transporter [Pseudoclavibacter caeni]
MHLHTPSPDEDAPAEPATPSAAPDSPTTASQPAPASATPRRPATSTAHRRIALLSLALGGFGIGMTEFVTMGILPQLAQGLLPDLAATDPEAANAQAGHLISAYAAGVVVGAPLVTAFTARWAKRRLLLTVLVWLAVANLGVALAPVFSGVMMMRFLAGLPHGVYFGVASIVAARLIGVGAQSRGGAFVLGGLTVANVIGVPFGTWIGQLTSWRSAYLVVAAIFTLTLVAVALFVPGEAGDPDASIATEFRAFRRPQVWLTIAMGAIGFGGWFAFYSYISPIATDVVGAPEALVPLVLVVTGIGMTIGNALGGRFGDRSLFGTILASFALMLVLMIIGPLVLGVRWAGATVMLFAFVLLMGVGSSMLGPAAQARLMQVAPGSETIAAASHHAAFNLANSLGAFLGGLVVASGAGYLATLHLGVWLTLTGMAIMAVSFGLDLRPRRMPLPR